MGQTQNTGQHKRHRQQVRRARPSCGICGQAINYDLPWLDPMSYVLDHIVPVALGGDDSLDNKQAAHRHCNQVKSSRIDGNGIVKRSSSLARPGGQPLP